MTSATAAPRTTTPNPSRGRPRDEERTAAILDATHTVLQRNGWDELTVSQIAKEAGCGLATIYRRWPTKEELVAAAMTDKKLLPFAETGDPAADLATLVETMAADVAAMGEGIVGFMAATQTEPVLREAMQNCVLAIVRPRYRHYLGQLLGDDHPLIDLLIDAIAGALIIRVGMLGAEQVPSDYADEVMALVHAITP